jgi:large repetitive protein
MKKNYTTSLLLFLFGLLSFNSFAQINAVDDSFSGINGSSGWVSPISILINDTINGSVFALTDVTLTSGVLPSGFILNPDGTISVASGTIAGTYTFNYQICETANPTNCDMAVITISVVAGSIDAVADNFNILNNGSVLVTQSVLTNDLLDGVPVTPINVVLTPLSFPAGFTLNPDGTITVAAGTPSGAYTFTYQLCETLNPSNCDTATVTITIGAVIDAVNDIMPSVNGGIGNLNLGNVLNNNGNGPDTLNGNPVTISQVNLSVVSPASPIGAAPVPTLNPSTGVVYVPSNTPVSTYVITYTICEILNPTNCNTAIVIVPVGASTIDAVNDAGMQVNGTAGGQSLANVLVNDTLNGVPATLTNVNLTMASTTNSGVTLNPLNGSVNIAAGTPAGSYMIIYQICEILNPTNCDAATVTIQIEPAIIDAVNDNFTAVCDLVACVTPTVFSNDTLNGVSFTPSSVTLTPGVLPSGFLMNPDGTITIAAGTPAGSYTITYQICEILNPTNCDVATVNFILSNTLLAPTGSTSQSLTIGSTITNLVVVGQNVLWYANNYSGKSALFADTPLPTTTLLVNGSTYYASQTISGIESTSRLPITVSLTPLANANFAFNDFRFFPNPVKNTLTISNATTINEVEITSVLGQNMLTKKVNDLQIEINLSELSNGIYFVKVKSEGEEKTFKIVKE